jgi:hypothetical protein
MIDWQSLLRRYIAIKYVPKAGTEKAEQFSAEELAALEAMGAEKDPDEDEGDEREDFSVLFNRPRRERARARFAEPKAKKDEP